MSWASYWTVNQVDTCVGCPLKYGWLFLALANPTVDSYLPVYLFLANWGRKTFDWGKGQLFRLPFDNQHMAICKVTTMCRWLSRGSNIHASMGCFPMFRCATITKEPKSKYPNKKSTQNHCFLIPISSRITFLEDSCQKNIKKGLKSKPHVLNSAV